MSKELVPVDPFHGYLEDMSEGALARLPDEFEFCVLEKWFNDYTDLTRFQQAEDLQEFMVKLKDFGFEVHIWSPWPEAGAPRNRHYKFSRLPIHRKPTPPKAPALPDSGVIDV